MDLLTLLSFTVLAGLLVISPGPNGVLIAKTVPTSGSAAGFANIFGFVPAFLLHGAFSIFGISVILLQSPWAFLTVKLIGAAYLFWIGVNAFVSAFKTGVMPKDPVPSKRRRSLRAAFAEGFFTNLLNPKVSMFYLAAFPQFIAVEKNAVWLGFSLVLLHFLLNLVWFSSFILLLDRMAKFTRSGAAKRWIQKITGVVFIGFAFKLATLRP